MTINVERISHAVAAEILTAAIVEKLKPFFETLTQSQISDIRELSRAIIKIDTKKRVEIQFVGEE